MSNLDENQVLSIIPQDVRVRLTIDKPTILANDEVTLELKFEYKNDSTESYRFLLESTRPKEELTQTFWFRPSSERSSYEFQLSRLAQLEFSNYQLAFQKKGKPDKYRWTVLYYLGSNSLPESTIDVELKVDKTEEYFYLLKAASLDNN